MFSHNKSGKDSFILYTVGTEPEVFVPEVATEHDVFAGAIAFRVLVSARASF